MIGISWDSRPKYAMSRWESFNIHSTETGGCDGNYVEVVDGLNTGNFRRLIPRFDTLDFKLSRWFISVLRFCGSTRPSNHVSSNNELSIHYVTNSNNTGEKNIQHFKIL